MKKFILDTHTHTVASGHAYGTVTEMAEAASRAGLKLLAITDHAPKLPGGTHEMYFRNFKVIDRELFGVEILMGVELNIMDYEGSVDMEERVLKKMGICIASLHTVCLTPGTKEENTRTLLKVMENPYVQVIGHPDDGRYAIDYEAVVKGAKEKGVLIEINNSSLMPGSCRKNSLSNLTEILSLCQQYGQEIIVNTDAHFPSSVGRFEGVEALLEKTGFPEELVVNTDVGRLKKYLTY
ncbi:MAG: phosphatase [Lachnospiraceae bacterium]|jgi:putative hydrolase|nr:phosphatase [Lachnospiraceae bacterium]